MPKKGNIKNLFGQRTKSQIEIDEKVQKIDTSCKNYKMRNYNDSSISEHQMGKKLLKTKPVIIIKLPGLAEDLFYQIKSMSSDNTIVDEFSENSSGLSSEPEESKGNLTLLTKILYIIPRQVEGNWLFHSLNNLVLGW